jgi:hypothetical protein
MKAAARESRMWSDRVGRGLVALGVAIAGSLGVFLLVKAVVFHAEIGFMSMRVEGPPVQVPLLAILFGYVLLLVQMLRNVTAALGCGGLLGLLLALAGFGLVLTDAAANGGTDFDLALFLAMGAAGLALAVGALLRLVARRVPPPAKPSVP